LFSQKAAELQHYNSQRYGKIFCLLGMVAKRMMSQDINIGFVWRGEQDKSTWSVNT
jgi:hypothetical protein